MVLALTSAEAIKELAGVPGSSYDVPLAAIAEGINRAVEGILGRPLEDSGADVTEYYDGTGTDALQLQRYPVWSITSIYSDIERLWPSSSEVASTDYVIYKSSGIVSLLRTQPVFDAGFSWPRARQNIRVIYRGGYRDTSPGLSIPLDLRTAATVWGASVFNKRRDLGIGSRSIEEVSETFLRAALPDEAKLMLSRYRCMAPGIMGAVGT